MSYSSYSVREVINLVNAPVNGWFLPSIQRPYVWGSRYESELYICKLFDSLLRGYPIGGLIVWNTKEEIPFREFMQDYHNGSIPSLVDKGQWKRPDKWLVYDGQQRLQTLFSCLRYTFNGKVLLFNLLFDLDKEDREMDETGFFFVAKNETSEPHFVRLNSLFTQKPDQDVEFEEQLFASFVSLSKEQVSIAKKNLKRLWKVFVETDKKSLAYFPIDNKREEEVNEVFQRLNTGGVPLSLADLLLSRIKEDYFDFEENLQVFSRDIYSRTANGYTFSHYEILQLIYLIHKGTMRIDPKQVDSSKDTKAINEVWLKLGPSLDSFFVDFIWGQFKINNSSIVPRQRALLPLIVYFFELYNNGVPFKKLKPDALRLLNQYFILSQVNDWSLQSLIDNFSKTVREKSKQSNGYFDFPLNELLATLDKSKKRETALLEARFTEYTWFSLKVLTPQRVYQFDPDSSGRFSPEIDHIFPAKLKDQSDEYYDSVDIIWNMQPVKGEVNNYKRRKHPLEFFTGDGHKYLKDYDFLPSHDLSSDVWKQPLPFIKVRRVKMIKFLKDEYGLQLK